MKRNITKTALLLCAFGCTLQAFAGNKDRTGQAGAMELLINPWGQTNGVFGLNTSYVHGLEAMKSNIAGLALVQNTEVGLAHSLYLRGSGVTVSDIGIAQKIGSSGVLGLNIMSMGFGEINVTTTDDPEGIGTGTYKPQFLTFQVGYAKEFSNSIRAGLGVTLVSEQISNIHAMGAAFEGGVQYVTGKRDNFHFGVTLRNVGTNMRFSGQGFAFAADMPGNLRDQQFSGEVPTEKFEMPTYLNFGASYDFYLDAKHLKGEDDLPKHRATVMANFTSNSFNNDYYGAAVEYAYQERFMLRAGYRYEKGIGTTDANTFYTGLSAGASIQQAIGETGPILAIDYAFLPTIRPNNGVHTFTLRIMTRAKSKKSSEE
jgi:hypothetical protein